MNAVLPQKKASNADFFPCDEVVMCERYSSSSTVYHDLCFNVFLETHVGPKWILKRLYSRHVTSHHLNHVDPDVWCQMASPGLYEFRNNSVSSCLFCRIRIIYLMAISSSHLDICMLHWYLIAVSRTITKFWITIHTILQLIPSYYTEDSSIWILSCQTIFHEGR